MKRHPVTGARARLAPARTPDIPARSRRCAFAVLLAAVLAGGCAGGGAPHGGPADSAAPSRADSAQAGRLRAPVRRWRRSDPLAVPGLHALQTDGRPALLQVPGTVSGDRPLPLIVMLHGAGSSPRSGLRNLRKVVGDARVALLAPASRAGTWDVVIDGFGPDVAALNRLLRRVSARLPVDRSHLALAGHSDGASYALSLGLTNGDVFSHIIAFSPGFIASAARRGRPLIYDAHGVRDEVLPIDRTSRQLVPVLRKGGYRVRYREFAGGHGVPAEVAREALEWFLGP